MIDTPVHCCYIPQTLRDRGILLPGSCMTDLGNTRRTGAGAAILLGAAMLLLCSVAAHSQDTPAALAEKLKDLTSQLRMQREQQARERRLTESRREILLEEIETLRKQEAQLTAKRDALEETSEELEKSLEELDTKAEALDQTRIEAEKLLGEKTAALVNHVVSGLPIDIEGRRDTVQNMSAGLETPADEMKLLWHLYVQEYRRASEIELTSPSPEGGEPSKAAPPTAALTHTIELEGGAMLRGRVLRIGCIGAVFLSDEGNIAAMLVRTEKGCAWRRLSERADIDELRRAFEIASGRRAPEIVNIPLQPGAGGGR